MKKLNVTVQCPAVYNSAIEVPDEMSLDEAIDYAQAHLDDIPLGPLEYVRDSDQLDLDNCDFDVIGPQIHGVDLNNSPVIRVGEKHIFTFLFNDGDCAELQNYNGCTGTVTHKWEKEQYIGAEPWEKVNSHGGLFEVVFEDGSEFDVYGDELQPVQSIDKKKLPLANRIQSASFRAGESHSSDKAPIKEPISER